MKSGHHELYTEAALAGRHKNSWNIHPKPQMHRDNFVVLNAGWTLNERPIRVPFAPQSILSEYQGEVGDNLVYETYFEIPDAFVKKRILLHFGAVDQIAEVYVNDMCVGSHAGGYHAFTFDITEAVRRDGTNHLVVKVEDTLSLQYPYGKQCKKRGGMWYTPISGIWQSVWLENVPEKYLERIELCPDLQGVGIKVYMPDVTGFTVRIALHNGEILEERVKGAEGYISLQNHICQDGKSYVPKCWTPDTPFLYQMKIVAEEDEVDTYFALRTVSIREIGGIRRVCLNEKPIFLHGVLDQGYYCDGIYLPAEPEEYERDILRMKELGMNLLRKHIKIEPEAFYYYCDKHGMLVMQDMVNSGKYSFLRDTVLPTIGMKNKKDTGKVDSQRRAIFETCMEQTVSQLYNHPCIIAYTIFNEGWGQFCSDEMYDKLKKLDGSRLIDSTSGWFAQEKSDFDSEHIYFRTVNLKVGKRPLLVSECGGYSYVVSGHHYSLHHSYGYGKARNVAELTDRIVKMYRKMILPAVAKGVCGCIYTQLSDVEDEVNGFYTYDRKVCKVEKDAMRAVAQEIQKALDAALAI